VIAPRDAGAGYTQAGQAWEHGPGRLIYNRLAEVLVGFSPVDLAGQLVLDVGSGTGAASHAVQAAGGRVVATDLAVGMLRVNEARRPPAAVADAGALPFRSAVFSAVVASFCLNHLPEPSVGVFEAGRVLDSGGVLLVSTYAAEDDHPVKAAVESGLREAGWRAPRWYGEMKRAAAAWNTVELATEAVERAGLRVLAAERRQVPFPHLGPRDLVEWRLGMAPAAWFVEAMSFAERRALASRCEDWLGAPPPLVRQVILVSATPRRPSAHSCRSATVLGNASPRVRSQR